MAQQYYVPAQMARRELQRQQAAKSAIRRCDAVVKRLARRAQRDDDAGSGRGRAHGTAGADRADAGQDSARRLQRAAARGSDGRLLVQPLQRVLGQGSGARLPDRVRARRDPAARARHVPRAARQATAEEPGDALLSRQLAERGAGGARTSAPAQNARVDPRNPDACPGSPRATAAGPDRPRTAGGPAAGAAESSRRGSTRTTRAS